MEMLSRTKPVRSSLLTLVHHLNSIAINDSISSDCDHNEQLRKERNLFIKNLIKERVKEERINTLKPFPKHFNLLTWNAKEQIKYLNKKDQANWNAPKLYEKFVFSSLKSCENLLLSTWKPQTYEDLERHDRLVMDKWERIILHKNTKLQLEFNIFNELNSSRKLSLLKNSCGLSDVYFERKTMLVNRNITDNPNISLLRRLGPISSLITTDIQVKKLFDSNNIIRFNEFKNLDPSQQSQISMEYHLFVTKKKLAKLVKKLAI